MPETTQKCVVSSEITKACLDAGKAGSSRVIQLAKGFLTVFESVQETDNPDLRDRAYIYWRLLSTDPEAAKEVVLSEKPVIDTASSDMEPVLLNTLLSNLSSLASVYHKPPEVPTLSHCCLAPSPCCHVEMKIAAVSVYRWLFT